LCADFRGDEYASAQRWIGRSAGDAINGCGCAGTFLNIEQGLLDPPLAAWR